MACVKSDMTVVEVFLRGEGAMLNADKSRTVDFCRVYVGMFCVQFSLTVVTLLEENNAVGLHNAFVLCMSYELVSDLHCKVLWC